MTDTISVAILLVALALFVIGGAFACYVFSKALFHVIQTLGFARALIEQAKTSYAMDVAKEHIERDRGPVEVPVYDDATLRAAARDERGSAGTGPSFIPGYDTPPPAAGDARIGEEIDGGTGDEEPIPRGGHYRQ